MKVPLGWYSKSTREALEREHGPITDETPRWVEPNPHPPPEPIDVEHWSAGWTEESTWSDGETKISREQFAARAAHQADLERIDAETRKAFAIHAAKRRGKRGE